MLRYNADGMTRQTAIALVPVTKGCGRISKVKIAAMAATYPFHVIDAADTPRAADPADQHLVDVYASEINKTASIWQAFDGATLGFRPHPKSTSVGDIFKHELLSGRRFFGEFLGLPEPEAASVMPDPLTVDSAVGRLADLARARLPHIARSSRAWWAISAASD